MKKLLTLLAPIVLATTTALSTGATINTSHIINDISYWEKTNEQKQKEVTTQFAKDPTNLNALLDYVNINNQQMKHKNNKQAVYYNSYFGEINTNDYLNSEKVNYTLEPINGIVGKKLGLSATDGLTLNTAFAIKKGFYISQQEASIDQIACDQNKIDWNATPFAGDIATQNAIVNLSLNEISQKPLHEVPASDIIDPATQLKNKVEVTKWGLTIIINNETAKIVNDIITTGALVGFIAANIAGSFIGSPVTAGIISIIACIFMIYNGFIQTARGARGVSFNLFFGFILTGAREVN